MMETVTIETSTPTMVFDPNVGNPSSMPVAITRAQPIDRQVVKLANAASIFSRPAQITASSSFVDAQAFLELAVSELFAPKERLLRSWTSWPWSQAGTVLEDFAEDPLEQESSSEDMMKWLETQNDLLRAYEGEWVAFDGYDLVAHAPSFLDVMRQVDSLGVRNPLLVPVAPDQPFIG